MLFPRSIEPHPCFAGISWIPAPRPRGDEPRGNDDSGVDFVIPAKAGIH